MAYIGNSPAIGQNKSFRILDDIKSYVETFDGSSSSVINNSADSINVKNHRFLQAQRVTYSANGGTVITGLSDGQAAFIIKVDRDNFKLASSATNANNGTAIGIAPAGSTTTHKLTVAFDAINTKFLVSYNNGVKAKFTRASQLQISINGVMQEPQDSASPTKGFGFDTGSIIVFSTAPDGNDLFWGNLLADNLPTFDISDNDIDNFTGDDTTTSFSLSATPPDNRNVLASIDGVTQYPNDPDGTVRAYSVVGNIITFTSAPSTGAKIQVRHIGFAGANSGGSGSGGVTSVYGRTGAVVLKNSDSIVVGNITDAGWLSVGSTATFDNNVTIKGVLTYDDVSVVDALGFSTFREGLRIKDSKKLLLGDLAAGDCQFIHDGTDTFIQNKTGDLKIANNVAGDVGGNIIIQAMNGENSINCVHDAQVELFANNSKKLETSGGGVEITGVTTSTQRIDIDAGGLNVTGGISTFGGNIDANGTLDVLSTSNLQNDVTFVGAGSSDATWLKDSARFKLKDNAQIVFGNGQDLEIWHDSGHSWIKNQTGYLRFATSASGFTFSNENNTHSIAQFTRTEGCDLYWNGSLRLATTGGGISVSGIVTATSFNGVGIGTTGITPSILQYPNIRPTLDLNFEKIKKLDPRVTYIRTGPASYVDEFGIVKLVSDNVPRFDHDPVTRESKGLLIEQSITNQMTHIGISSDTAQNGTITSNQTTSPDGTMNGDSYVSNTTNGIHRVDHAFTSGQISNSTAYTFSVFVKANGVDKLHIRYGGFGADNHGLGYDVGAGTTFAGKFDGTSALDGVTSFSIDEYPNDWYRCIMTWTTASNATSGASSVWYYISNSESTTNYAGNNSAGMYFWGPQMEVGNVVTSLIPTNGTTAARGADEVCVEGTDFTDFYNKKEGTLVLSASFNEDIRASATANIYDVSNESEYTEIGYRAGGAASGGVGSYIRTDAGNDQYFHAYASSATRDGVFKVALGYKDSDYASSVNGQAVNTDTSGTTSKVYDRLRFGDVDNVGVVGSGHYRRFIYYSKRLPNAQLVAVSS